MTRMGSILGKENCIVKCPELFKEHNNFLLNCYENNYQYRRRTERCKSAWSAVYIIQLQHVPSMFSASWLMFRSKLFRKIAVLKIDPAGHISWHNQVTVHVFCSTVLLALTQTLFCYIYCINVRESLSPVKLFCYHCALGSPCIPWNSDMLVSRQSMSSITQFF